MAGRRDCPWGLTKSATPIFRKASAVLYPTTEDTYSWPRRCPVLVVSELKVAPSGKYPKRRFDRTGEIVIRHRAERLLRGLMGGGCVRSEVGHAPEGLEFRCGKLRFRGRKVRRFGGELPPGTAPLPGSPLEHKYERLGPGASHCRLRTKIEVLIVKSSDRFQLHTMHHIEVFEFGRELRLCHVKPLQPMAA